MIELNENFWQNKYKTNKIGWGLGKISSPLKKYFDQLTDKKIETIRHFCE